jgi:16S rRNA processing protein RimM
MPKPKNPIQLAVIGAAHGIKGEVRVKTFTRNPLSLGGYGPLYARDGRAFEILDIRPQGTVVVVRLKGVNDRNAAEALTGTALFVDRSALPEDLDDEEFYHADLVGLDVRDTVGDVIGRVTAIHNYGGGDILELALADGDVLIPFTKAAVPVVSVASRSITIDAIAAGLVSDEDNAGASGSNFGQPKGGLNREQRPRGPRNAGGNR